MGFAAAAFLAPLALRGARARAGGAAPGASMCALGGDDGPAVRFRRGGAEDAARTSFGPAPAAGGATDGGGLASPNERALADVQATMERLGVSADPRAPPPPPPRKLRGYAHVRPLSALAGAGVAAVMSAALWVALQAAVAAYVARPFASDVYALNRITGIIRTAVVGLLALASGMSGVTAAGLALLFLRVSADAVQRALPGSAPDPDAGGGGGGDDAA